jgi:hypothetical protein
MTNKPDYIELALSAISVVLATVAGCGFLGLCFLIAIYR